MLVIRDIMYCKPGKVRPLVEKFQKLAKLVDGQEIGPMRIMTDVSAEQFWTVVAEIETPSLEAFMAVPGGDLAAEFQDIMKGYHELVDSGRREIYTLEK